MERYEPKKLDKSIIRKIEAQADAVRGTVYGIIGGSFAALAKYLYYVKGQKVIGILLAIPAGIFIAKSGDEWVDCSAKCKELIETKEENVCSDE